jgi:ISXO2-like transposase domain
VNAKTVREIVIANVRRESELQTDEGRHYIKVGWEFARHGTVRHRLKEYVVGKGHTNTIEGFFGLFKRGMKGIYQHCREQHLHRYLAEFDFRYNNRAALGIDDVSRAERALGGAVGKRLFYRDSTNL